MMRAMQCEAHLPSAHRGLPLVRWISRRTRRSWAGWLIFVGLIVLNETRGLYVVIHVIKAWQAH